MARSKLARPRKLGRSPGVRFARRRGFAGMAFLLTAALAHPAWAQVHRCDGGQIVKDNPSFDYCSAFRQYLKPEQGVIDRKLETILKNDGSLKGKLRSYAFVVSVSKYPNLQNPDDQVIKGVGAELDTIVDFLKAQGFDEIVVLTEEQASHENIDYFLSDYFLTAFRKQRDQDRLARFLFAFDGHGMPGNDPDTHGALALSEATGDDDIDLGKEHGLLARLEVGLRVEAQAIGPWVQGAVGREARDSPVVVGHSLDEGLPVLRPLDELEELQAQAELSRRQSERHVEYVRADGAHVLCVSSFSSRSRVIFASSAAATPSSVSGSLPMRRSSSPRTSVALLPVAQTRKTKPKRAS